MVRGHCDVMDLLLVLRVVSLQAPQHHMATGHLQHAPCHLEGAQVTNKEDLTEDGERVEDDFNAGELCVSLRRNSLTTRAADRAFVRVRPAALAPPRRRRRRPRPLSHACAAGLTSRALRLLPCSLSSLRP